MKPLPAWLSRLLAGSAGLLLFLYLTAMFVPTSELQRVAARMLAPHGLTLAATSLGKALPLGISGQGLTLASERGALLRLDRLTLRLRLLPLLAGRVVIAGTGKIGTGTLQGEVELTNKGSLEFSSQKVRLEDIPFFATVAGAQAKGELRIKAEVRSVRAKASGTVQMETRDLDLSGIRISETPLPDASYRTMQGMMRIAAGRMTLESMTLEGEGLYVRLRGDLPAGSSPAASPLNLTLELMPKPDFLERQKFVFLLLTKYLTTPGHYQLPIRGTLAKPVLQ